MPGCKLLTDEGDFKIDVVRGRGLRSRFKQIVKNYKKYTIKWHLVGVLGTQMVAWFVFAIVWFVLSRQTPQGSIEGIETFADALSFSMGLQLKIGYVVDGINPQCKLAVILFFVHSLIAFVLHILLLVLIVRATTDFLISKETFTKITFDDTLIFHKVVDEVVQKPHKHPVNVSERRESTVGERRGSVVTYRKASIFGRRASRAEGHRFCRQKATKSSRYEKLKTKKNAKEQPKSCNEVFKMMVGVEEDEDNVILLGIYGFLLVKKKAKSALLDFLEILASREIKFQKEEIFNTECEYCSGMGRPKQLVHTIDEDSPMTPLMEFIFKKKKWYQPTETNQGNDASGQKSSRPKPEIEHVALWPDETISVSKMELEVIVVIQYQHFNSSRLSEARKSFDLADFRFHSSFEESE